MQVDKVIRKEIEGIHFLQFEIFNDFKKLKHGVILRQGGVSHEPFDSLNLSHHVGDNKENVLENEKRVLSIFDLKMIAKAQLSHGKTVLEVNSKEHMKQLDGDGLVTSILDTGLMITHADCQAAIFYDPILHIVANVHSGWRGSVQNIYQETVNYLKNRYQSNPKNLLVAISPSLGPKESEFIHYQKELPKSFWQYQISPNYFDFWKISEVQLMEAGILRDHLQIARISTFSSKEDYFSYRRDQITGRNATLVALL